MNERLGIDALRALLAIADHGGVTRAAGHLGLSQSAVSHKVRRLEQTLDCDLLTRRAGGALFTKAGERLCAYARRITDLHDEALADLVKKQLAGTISLGMTEDMSTSGLAKILGRFTRLYPAVNVKTRTGQSLNVQAWLKSGELDIAVIQVFADDVAKNDIVLFRDSLHWVKSRDYALDPSQPIPFLSFDENCFYRQWGYGDGQRAGHRFNKVLECPSAAGICAAVQSGLGVALLNGLHLNSEIEVIKGVFPPPPEIVFVARVRPKSNTGPVKALVGEIGREFALKAPIKAPLKAVG